MQFAQPVSTDDCRAPPTISTDFSGKVSHIGGDNDTISDDLHFIVDEAFMHQFF